MYKVLEYFTDNLDNGYVYNVGDVYPHEGYTPTQERIEALAGVNNARKRPVIEMVFEESKAEDVPDINVGDIEEKPKRRKKREG